MPVERDHMGKSGYEKAKEEEEHSDEVRESALAGLAVAVVSGGVEASDDEVEVLGEEDREEGQVDEVHFAVVVGLEVNVGRDGQRRDQKQHDRGGLGH